MCTLDEDKWCAYHITWESSPNIRVNSFLNLVTQSNHLTFLDLGSSHPTPSQSVGQIAPRMRHHRDLECFATFVAKQAALSQRFWPGEFFMQPTGWWNSKKKHRETKHHILKAEKGKMKQKWRESIGSIWIYEYMKSHLQKIAPPKLNMEPENDSFQKKSPFPGVDFQVPC